MFATYVSLIIKWLDIEIHLHKSCINSYTTKVSDHTPGKFKSKVLWVGNTNQLMELLSSVWYGDLVKHVEGGDLSYSAFIHDAEIFFNRKITKPFDRRAQLAARKKNPTPLLDYLKRVFTEKIIKLKSDI